MEALDGNAIAGALFEHFGVEMTTAHGSCAYCGMVTQIAELRVYSRAPGHVVRCPSCGDVLFVLVDIRSNVRTDLGGFRPLEASGQRLRVETGREGSRTGDGHGSSDRAP